jgi:hypothetical protein
MPREHLGNEFATVLTDAITYQDDVIRVANASGFPQLQFRVRIGNELLIVYEVLSDLQSFRVIRGAESSNPAAHAQNSAVTIIATAGGMEQWLYDSYSEVPHGVAGAPEWRFLNTNTGLVYLDGAGSGAGSVVHVAEGVETLRTWPGNVGIRGDLTIVGNVATEANYPRHGSGGAGARRIRGPFASGLEVDTLSFQNVLPNSGTTVQIIPSGDHQITNLRFQDLAEPSSTGGAYLDISLDTTRPDLDDWRVTFATLIKQPPPAGPDPSPPGSVAFYFDGGDGTKMVVGHTGEGVTIGRHGSSPGMPLPGYLSVLNGIMVGGQITGAGPGDGYFERNVRARSVTWGEQYSRTEILDDFNEAVPSGTYIADNIDHAAQTGRVFLTQELYDPDTAVTAQLAFDEADSREIYIRVYNGSGNESWWKVFHQGNTLPVFGGSGIFPGPIGIGTLADLTDKDDGDLTVYNSITISNEPGGLFGELVGPTGSLRRQSGFRGLVVPNRQIVEKSARFGGQISTGGPNFGAAWMSYGGVPAGLEGPAISGTDVQGIAWRLGPTSYSDGSSIVAELLTGGGSSWSALLQVQAAGRVIIQTSLTVGTGGVSTGGSIVGRDITAQDFTTFVQAVAGTGKGILRARANGLHGDPRVEWVWRPPQTPPSPPPPSPRTYTAGINTENGHLEFVVGDEYVLTDPDAPDPRVLRMDWNSSVGIWAEPSGNRGDLSVGRAINVGTTGAITNEVLAQYHSSFVDVSSGTKRYHRMWASALGTQTNVNLGFNVSGLNDGAPARDDTTKPSWRVRFGEQDSFEILRAAPGGSSPWLTLFLLDPDGNLTTIGNSSLFSAINVGENLQAGLGEIRMTGAFYLARQPASGTTRQIMVETSSSGPHVYAPFFEASGSTWIVRGPGTSGSTLQLRVASSTGIFQITTSNGSASIVTMTEARGVHFDAGVSIGMDGGDDFPYAPINDLYVQRQIRTGIGSLDLPAYSFYGSVGDDPDPSIAGIYFKATDDDGGTVNVATVPTSGSTPHHTLEITANRVRVNTHLVPLEGASASDSHYDLGGHAFQAWRYGFFHRGVTIGGRTGMLDAAYATNSQLRVYSQYPGPTVSGAQYIAAFQEDTSNTSGKPSYSSALLIVGNGDPDRPTMEIGMTFLPPDGTVEGYVYTDRFEGRPSHFINISRGDFIIGIGGNRRFHLNRFGSLGIGNVDPTQPDPDDPSPPNVLGDMTIAKSLIVGALNASLTAGGSEGEIIASKLTLVAGTTPGEGGSQFNSPLILANEVPIQGRVESSGDAYDLFWINHFNDVYLRGTPDAKVIFESMRTDVQDGEVAEPAMHIWPNRGVVIGPLVVSHPSAPSDTPPPPNGGLRVDGDVEIGARLILGPDTTILGLGFTDPDIPFLGVGIYPSESPQMALLSQGEIAWGPGGAEGTPFDTWLRRRTAGMLEIEDSLYINKILGIGLTPAYALDVQCQVVGGWTGRLVNVSPHGDGLYIRAGSTGSDTPFRVDNYPTAGTRLLTLDGAGGLALNGSLAVTDDTLPDPYHPSTTRKGEIRCEYIVVRNSTQYQFGDGGTIDIESAGLTLGNNVPLRGKDSIGNGHSLLWVDTGNLTHLRMATTQGLVLDGASTGTIALRVSNAGSLATGNATPTANQGDLSIARGLMVGSVSAAISGEIRAQYLSISSDASVTGTLTVGTLSVTGGGGLPPFSSDVVLNNGIAIAAKTTVPATVPLLWIDGSNVTHLRAGSTNGLRIEAFTSGKSALVVGDAGSLATGLATPSANQGDLTVGRGLNVGSASGAVSGEVRAVSGAFSGDVVITGNITAANLTNFSSDIAALQPGSISLPSIAWTGARTTGFYQPATDTIGITIAGAQRYVFGAGLMVGGPTGALGGQVAALQLIAQPSGANPVPTFYQQMFGGIYAGADSNTAITGVPNLTAGQSTDNLASASSVRGRGSSLLLYTSQLGLWGSAIVWAAPNGVNDPTYAQIRGFASNAGNGVTGGLSFFTRSNTTFPLIERFRLDYQGGASLLADVNIGDPASTTTPAYGAVRMFKTLFIANGTASGFSSTAPQASGELAVQNKVWIGGVPGGGTADSLQVTPYTGSGFVAYFDHESASGHGLMVRTRNTSGVHMLLDVRAFNSTGSFTVRGNGDVLITGGSLAIGNAANSPNVGDLSVGRALMVGPNLAGATSGELIFTGTMQMEYQSSAPPAPQFFVGLNSFMRWWPDSRGSLKITRPSTFGVAGSGGEWHVDIRENAFFNSDYDVWQRGTTFTGITTSQYTADRWYVSVNTGTLNVARTADQPTATQQGGHYSPYCFRVTSTTVVADASLVAGSLVGLRYSFEGRYWIRFAGRTQVMSAWVKSNRTITFSVAIRSGTLNRYFVQTFTIASADVWQFIWFLVPAGTITDFGLDSNLGAEVWFILAAGSSAKGANIGQWTAGTLLAWGAQGNLLSVVNSYLQIAHLKLENGEAPTPCLGRPWDDDIKHCLRYYVKTFPYTTVPAQNAGTVGALTLVTIAGNGAISWRFPVPMRLAPTTVTTYNPSALDSNWTGGIAAALADQSENGVTITGTLAASNGVRATIHAAAHADF